MTKRSTWSLIFLMLWVVVPRHAHAYLDPASGSMLLQLLLGGLAGAALFFKIFWHKIRSFFGGSAQDDDSSE